MVKMTKNRVDWWLPRYLIGIKNERLPLPLWSIRWLFWHHYTRVGDKGKMSLKVISNNKDTFMTNCHLYSLCRRRPWSGNKLYEWVYYYDYYNCMYQSESSKEVLSPLFGTRNLYSGNSQWWRSKGGRKKKTFINHHKKGLLKNT